MAFSDSDPSEVSLSLGLALGSGGLRRRLPAASPGYWAGAEEVSESSVAATSRRRNAAALPGPAPYPLPHSYNWLVQYVPVVAALPNWAPPQQPQQQPAGGPPALAAAGSGSLVSAISDIEALAAGGSSRGAASNITLDATPLRAVRPMAPARQQPAPFPYNVRWGRPEGARMPCMPCLAFTGDGPRGRRVLGYLRRANKDDITIICACHGAPFSPVGFMQHGGAVNLSEPLKRITVLGSD